MEGTSLGQYHLLELVDDNTIIQTYRASQTRLDREVAVHVVRPEYRQAHHYWRLALVRGAQMAARFAHPNIVPVLDAGQQGDIDYVVLRWMSGGTLLRRLETGPLPLREAGAVIRQIANALDYVHALGGYHGDPAPVNMIFDDVGNVYIAEFYLAGKLQTTDPREVTGVPAHMAPERLLAQPPTAFSDQFSLASVAYETLTGQLAWPSMAKNLQDDPMTPPQQHRADIPERVNPVLAKGLAREPEERYPTVLEFARQLEAALDEPDQHVFISYSRRDKAYAVQLRDYFIENGLSVWIDDRIEHGDQWFQQINDAIQGCVAFVVVMTPESEASEWVHKEILLAKRYGKPLYPVLLGGQEFPILIDIQYADVRGGVLPDSAYFRRVARAFHGA